jgi:hypothetical protein
MVMDTSGGPQSAGSRASQDPQAAATDRTPSRRRRAILVAAVIVAAAAIVVIVVADAGNRSVPSFPSLADKPDATLRGTVAYLDEATDCVRIVAAAGQPSKEVMCLPPLDPADAATRGKPVGPQLVWLADGRLEVTMFRMTDPPGPNFRPGWQKIVDVRTGAVTETPATQVPSVPDLRGRPTVSPDGARVSFTSNAESGHVTITLTDASGASRTLLDERGPGKYTYGVYAAFWSPDYTSIFADDGRILVITPGEPPTVRVLTEQSSSGLDGDQARFAVTRENLLTPDG